MPIDHVLIVVSSLAEAGQMINERYGLTSIEGGRHPGWGTANRIVPLGDTYLELIAVIDHDEANASVFGRWIAGGEPEHPIGWAVRTVDIEAVAHRLGLAVQAGSRTTPSGKVLRWRTAGVEQAIAEPSFPFFIEWSVETLRPGMVLIHHRAGSVLLSKLEIRGDSRRLTKWIDGEELPIVITPGDPDVSRIVLSADGQEILVPPS
jgi:glyoxalase-like protein